MDRETEIGTVVYFSNFGQQFYNQVFIPVNCIQIKFSSGQVRWSRTNGHDHLDASQIYYISIIHNYKQLLGIYLQYYDTIIILILTKPVYFSMLLILLSCCLVKWIFRNIRRRRGLSLQDWPTGRFLTGITGLYETGHQIIGRLKFTKTI